MQWPVALVEHTTERRSGIEPADSYLDAPVAVRVDGVWLNAELVVPEGARGLVVLVHGTQSARHSPWERDIAWELNERGLAALLLDLLTPAEASIATRRCDLRLDLPRLARRLAGGTAWVLEQPHVRGLRVGYFGVGAGAVAALMAAAAEPACINAVVACGGLAARAPTALPLVRAPTLLIAGADDHQVLADNRAALPQLRTEKSLRIVTGSTHHFEVGTTIDEVAGLARDWFARHLAVTREAARRRKRMGTTNQEGA